MDKILRASFIVIPSIYICIRTYIPTIIVSGGAAMNETEINLVREYVHIHYLIQQAVAELDTLKSSRISLKGLLEIATKSTGTKLKDKLRNVQKELRAAGLNAWLEDDGGEIIYVCTAKNGVKGRHGIKRRILLEEMESKLMEYADEFMISDHMPYKVELSAGDPYAHTYAKK